MIDAERRADVLSFIRGYTKDHGYAPSVRDIQVGCGLSSPSVAANTLKRLAEEQLLTMAEGRPRTIVLTEQGAALA